MSRESSKSFADQDAVRRELSKMVGANAAAIVQAAIEKATSGHFQAMKFLFAIAGIHPAQPKDEQSGDLSLAQLLCRELGLPEEAPPPVEKEAAQESAAPAVTECTVK